MKNSIDKLIEQIYYSQEIKTNLVSIDIELAKEILNELKVREKTLNLMEQNGFNEFVNRYYEYARKELENGK